MGITNIVRIICLHINIYNDLGEFMKWHNKLYCGASINNPKWVKFFITHGKNPKGYYCIALSHQKDNLLDIYESQFLRTTHLNTNDIYIIGISEGKKEAYEVVRDIIEDVYINTKGFDIRKFLTIES